MINGEVSDGRSHFHVEWIHDLPTDGDEEVTSFRFAFVIGSDELTPNKFAPFTFLQIKCEL